MLYPEIHLATENAICTCGKQNFRHSSDNRPVYDVYTLTLPKNPIGYTTHHICRDCLQRIFSEAGI